VLCLGALDDFKYKYDAEKDKSYADYHEGQAHQADGRLSRAFFGANFLAVKQINNVNDGGWDYK